MTVLQQLLAAEAAELSRRSTSTCTSPTLDSACCCSQVALAARCQYMRMRMPCAMTHLRWVLCCHTQARNLCLVWIEHMPLHLQGHVGSPLHLGSAVHVGAAVHAVHVDSAPMVRGRLMAIMLWRSYGYVTTLANAIGLHLTSFSYLLWPSIVKNALQSKALHHGTHAHTNSNNPYFNHISVCH